MWKLLHTGISGICEQFSYFYDLAHPQAKLEELQAEKQSVVSQKEAADDGNRKLVSADFFVCLIVNTYLPKWRQISTTFT